jgi:hypothetical protein
VSCTVHFKIARFVWSQGVGTITQPCFLRLPPFSKLTFRGFSAGYTGQTISGIYSYSASALASSSVVSRLPAELLVEIFTLCWLSFGPAFQGITGTRRASVKKLNSIVSPTLRSLYFPASVPSGTPSSSGRSPVVRDLAGDGALEHLGR